jgi:hypothetical protein
MEKDASLFFSAAAVVVPDEDSGCCGWKSVRIPPNDWDCCNVGEVSMVDLLDGSLLLLLDEDEDLKLLDSSSIGSDFMADDVIASSASIDCHSLSSVSSLWDLPAAISAISVAAAEARRKKRRRGEERRGEGKNNAIFEFRTGHRRSSHSISSTGGAEVLFHFYNQH